MDVGLSGAEVFGQGFDDGAIGSALNRRFFYRDNKMCFINFFYVGCFRVGFGGYEDFHGFLIF